MMRALLARELRLAWRSGAEILNPLWFFLIVITLFPFGVGAAPQLLAQIAPGVVWVVALLAVPLLIFATAACQAAAAGLPVSGYLAMLAAFLTASATLCPFATAAALRLTVR